MALLNFVILLVLSRNVDAQVFEKIDLYSSSNSLAQHQPEEQYSGTCYASSNANVLSSILKTSISSYPLASNIGYSGSNEMMAYLLANYKLRIQNGNPYRICRQDDFPVNKLSAQTRSSVLNLLNPAIHLDNRVLSSDSRAVLRGFLIESQTRCVLQKSKISTSVLHHYFRDQFRILQKLNTELTLIQEEIENNFNALGNINLLQSKLDSQALQLEKLKIKKSELKKSIAEVSEPSSFSKLLGINKISHQNKVVLDRLTSELHHSEKKSLDLQKEIFETENQIKKLEKQRSNEVLFKMKTDLFFTFQMQKEKVSRFPSFSDDFEKSLLGSDSDLKIDHSLSTDERETVERSLQSLGDRLKSIRNESELITAIETKMKEECYQRVLSTLKASIATINCPLCDQTNLALIDIIFHPDQMKHLGVSSQLIYKKIIEEEGTKDDLVQILLKNCLDHPVSIPNTVTSEILSSDSESDRKNIAQKIRQSLRDGFAVSYATSIERFLKPEVIDQIYNNVGTLNHAMAIVGYERRTDQYYYSIQNSWGESHCQYYRKTAPVECIDKGRFIISESFLFESTLGKVNASGYYDSLLNSEFNIIRYK